MDPLTILIIVLVVIIAFAIVISLVKREKVSTDILYSDALNAILKGENSEAIKLLKQVVSQDSDNIGAYLQLGNLVRSNNPRQAAKIHQSLTVRPKLSKHISKEIHQALALDYLEVHNYGRAKIEADMVLKSDKNNLWGHQFLLKVAEQENEWDKAKSIAEKIQKLTRQSDKRQLAKILYNASLDSIKNGDNKKAIQLLQKAIKTDTSYDKPYLSIANVFEEEGNLKKAITNWENYLINALSSDVGVYKKIETALFESNRFSEAEQLYSRILSKKPEDKNALIKLTNLLIDRGELDESIKLLDSIIKKNDKSYTARLLKIKLILEKANPIDLRDQLDELINQEE